MNAIAPDPLPTDGAGRHPGGWHPESGLPLGPRGPQTSLVTTTSTRPARPSAPAQWQYRSSVRTAAELLLGLSFTAAVAFGGYSAVTGRMGLFAQGAAIVFLVTLTCVLVSWFRAVELEDTADRSHGFRD